MKKSFRFGLTFSTTKFYFSTTQNFTFVSYVLISKIFFLVRVKIYNSNLKNNFELTVGALGCSNSIESFLTTLFVVVEELLQRTAGNNDVEEVDEM